MELSPKMYKLFVRPNWVSKLYIEDVIRPTFDYTAKNVLDFGCGIGSNCFIFDSRKYIGVDCDSKRVSYAKKINPCFDFRTVSSSTLPVQDNWADYILISSVMHHIPSDNLNSCIKEFKRTLSPKGVVLVLEPVLIDGSWINNHYMRFFDKGKFIRNEHDYLDFFHNNNFKTKVLKKYTQLFLYNKVFFIAEPID